MEQLLKTTSPTVQKLLEQKVDDLEKQILNASKVRKKAEIQKEDLKRYLASITEIMTHPAKALVEPTDQQTIRRIWGITFSKFPTYDELKSRTPELSLAFELSQGSKLSKERMVAPMCPSIPILLGWAFLQLFLRWQVAATMGRDVSCIHLDELSKQRDPRFGPF